MSTRILNADQAASLVRMSEQDLSDAWQINSDDGFRPATKSYPENKVLTLPIHRHSGQNDPKDILLLMIGRNVESLNENESALIEKYCVLHDSLSDILSMRALESGISGIFDESDIVRLPRLALCLRSPLDIWLDHVSEPNVVKQAPWYNPNHPSGDKKLTPTRGDQILNNVAGLLPKKEFNEIFDHADILSIVRILTDARDELSEQVHFTVESILVNQSDVILKAITMLDCVSMVRNARGVASSIIAKNFGRGVVPQISECIKRYAAPRAASHEYSLTGDAYIASIRAGTYKGGVGLEITGAVKCEKDHESAFDIRFNLTAGFSYSSLSLESGDDSVTFNDRSYFQSSDRPTSSISEAVENYLNSTRSSEHAKPYSKVSVPIVEHLTIKFPGEAY